jgi:hypothetical protein
MRQINKTKHQEIINKFKSGINLPTIGKELNVSRQWISQVLKQNGINFSGEYRAYGIHMFHEIISENRLEDRGDDRKLHTGEKY